MLNFGSITKLRIKNMKQGASWSMLLRWYTDSTKTVRKNLTGYLGRGQIRLTDDSAKIIDLTVTISTPPTLGEVVVSLTPTQTTLLDFTVAKFDVELYTTGDADVLRPVQGEIVLDKEITKIAS